MSDSASKCNRSSAVRDQSRMNVAQAKDNLQHLFCYANRRPPCWSESVVGINAGCRRSIVVDLPRSSVFLNGALQHPP